MNAAASLKTEKEQVLTLLQQVEENFRTMRGSHSGFLTLQDSILQMEKCIFSFDEYEPAVAAVLDQVAPEILSSVHHAYRQWQDKLEFNFAQRLIQDEAALSDYFLYNRFEELVRRELALVSETSLQRILFVGNGPLPISAIHAHLQTGLPVDCVARDDEADEQRPRRCGVVCIAAAVGNIRIVADWKECSCGLRFLGEALAIMQLAVSPTLEGRSGLYFNVMSESRANPQAYDAKARAELRKLSRELTGL